jgi:regulatory protein
LAIHYLGRYATTRARLSSYLVRKLRARGWSGDDDRTAQAEVVAAIVERCAGNGYVNDQVFAEGRAASLARKGYGHRRVEQALRSAGVDTEIVDTLNPDEAAARAAAELYARRRRFGRFGDANFDAAVKRKQLAAMIRAGHSYELARLFVGEDPNELTSAD